MQNGNTLAIAINGGFRQSGLAKNDTQIIFTIGANAADAVIARTR
jgi:hypothetical protein